VTDYNDLFVAAVALVGSVTALAASVGPWTLPYRLRTFSAIADRFGMTVARAAWMVVAIVSLMAGIAIACGIRPGYAVPSPPPGGAESGAVSRNG